MRCLEPDDDGHIMIHLLISKLPFFHPYNIVSMNLPACVVSYANELTIAADLGGNYGFETPLPLPAPHHQKSGYRPDRVFKSQLPK